MLGLLVALWGSAFAFARIAVESVAPEWTMAGRLIMGAALLLPLALGAGKMLPREGGHWRWLVGLALVGNIAPFFVISWGQQHVPSALAGILIGFTPLATLVIAHFLLAEERITRLRLTGFATGFAGLVIVLGPSALADMASGGDRLLGQLAVLAGAFFFACNNVMARLAPEMPLLVKSSGVMVAGAVAGTAIAGAVTPPAALASASAASLFGVAGLGIFSTGLAALVFFRLVDRAGPAFVSLTNYLVPVFASLAGFFVFGEELNFRILTGLSLILAGIAVSEWRATFKE
ncbi:MAG: hypothetical protein AMXMBFR74_14870 [Parvibaculum sp.]